MLIQKSFLSTQHLNQNTDLVNVRDDLGVRRVFQRPAVHLKDLVSNLQVRLVSGRTWKQEHKRQSITLNLHLINTFCQKVNSKYFITIEMDLHDIQVCSDIKHTHIRMSFLHAGFWFKIRPLEMINDEKSTK